MAKQEEVDGVREGDSVTSGLEELFSKEELEALSGFGNISGVIEREASTEINENIEVDEEVEEEVAATDPRLEKVMDALSKLTELQSKGKEEVKETKEPEKFPDPPKPPRRPASYSREEAASDPKSASAKYDNDMAEYQEVYSQWQAYHAMYLTKRLEEMEEASKAREEALREEIRTLDARREADANAIKYARQKGLNETMAKEFLEMVNEFKVTPDSLLEIFKLKKGIGSRRAGESNNFKQRERASRGTGGNGRSTSVSQTPAEAIFGVLKKLDESNQPF